MMDESIRLLESRIRELEATLGDYCELVDYLAHASWRCSYRSRYKECVCGLDELTVRLGLARVEVVDPEGK